MSIKYSNAEACHWPSCSITREVALNQVALLTLGLNSILNPHFSLSVTGKEFRAVFISTVRTSLTCHSSYVCGEESSSQELLYWEFLSDATLLNTAITRAKSLVAVVGDPISLCTIGECRGNWRDYIKRCNDRKALHGASYEELQKQINASLTKISLNPQAANFVPKSMAEVGNQECKSIEECRVTQQDMDRDDSLGLELAKDMELASSVFLMEDNLNNPMTKKEPGLGTYEEDVIKGEASEEDEEKQEEAVELEDDSTTKKRHSMRGTQGAFQKEDQNLTYSSQDEAEDGQDTSTFFDEFRRESLEDETVFPRYMDKIIKALVEKCRETKESDARLNAAFPSLQAAKISVRKKENQVNIRPRQEKPSFSDLFSEDYQILHINGRTVARLVNPEFHRTQSPLVKRLTTSPRQYDYLDPEILERFLHENPGKYLPCTLRLNSERFRSAYAVVSDTKTPDIKINGRVRGVFDMDRVVIKKTACLPSSRDDALHSQGKIVGTLYLVTSSEYCTVSLIVWQVNRPSFYIRLLI